MNRREFLEVLGTTAALSHLGIAHVAQAQTGAASLTIDSGAPGATIPRDYVGLSYEAAQLANPDFFSVKNTRLIELVRGLSPSGNLRIGGGSSEYTSYSNADPVGPPPFDAFSPATSKIEKKETVTTALALRNLRGFLDATGWSCLYGLNLVRGTKENAANEAAAAYRILGPRLVALQIANEPDAFRNHYRPATYGPDDFMKEWNDYHDAIVAKTPGAKFAGPDISNKFAYITTFAAEAPKHPDVILLTGHFYAMGPAGSPNATLDQLFEPDPKLATMHPAQVQIIQDARKTANLPYRMSEGNSCWDGGKPGVSDTLASALWCANMMLRFAQYGWAGVNLHGGGQGLYTPIAGMTAATLTRRPEYFGIQFAQQLTGATFLPITLTGAAPHVTAYALEHAGKRRIVVFNVYDTPLALTLPARPQATAHVLTGESLSSKEGTTLGKVRIPRRASVTVPAHSAVIYDL